MQVVKLYRALSEDEFQDLIISRAFRVGPNSLLGKWFAKNADDAVKWGEALLGRGNFRIIIVEIPIERVKQFFKLERLDNIGPAYYAEIELLSQVNFQELLR